jgi:hypothetical protein
MPQPCTICTHPKRKEIDLAIIRGEQSNRALAKQFELTHHALLRHSKEHLALVIQQAQAERHRADKIDCNAELYKCFQRVSKLSDACEEWLKDPEDPDAYTLEPRTTELNVIYDEWDGERWVKRRATLSELLAGVESPTLRVKVVESKVSDPRKLLLDSCGQLTEQIERVGKLFGLLNHKDEEYRLATMRNAVREIRRKLSQGWDRQVSWEETIDEILKYQENPLDRAYLNKLRAEGDDE